MLQLRHSNHVTKGIMEAFACFLLIFAVSVITWVLYDYLNWAF